MLLKVSQSNRTGYMRLGGIFVIVVGMISAFGCYRPYREDLDYSYNVLQQIKSSDFESGSLVQFERVDWDEIDQTNLRNLIVDDSAASGRDVLLIGTGPGLMAMLCLQYGANNVVGSDTNDADVANARYNIAVMEMDKAIEIRHAAEGDVLAAVKPTEQFELIVVDLQNQLETDEAENSKSGVSATELGRLMDELRGHLKLGGRLIAMCRHSDQLEQWKVAADECRFETKVIGQREATSLQQRIYPALLLEIRAPNDASDTSIADDPQ